MPLFEIEQCELCVETFRVEAASEADAIHKLFNDEVQPVPGSRLYVELANDFGMPADENVGLVDALNKLGHRIDPDDVIPSIRDIHEIDPQTCEVETKASQVVEACNRQATPEAKRALERVLRMAEMGWEDYVTTEDTEEDIKKWQEQLALVRKTFLEPLLPPAMPSDS